MSFSERRRRRWRRCLTFCRRNVFVWCFPLPRTFLGLFLWHAPRSTKTRGRRLGPWSKERQVLSLTASRWPYNRSAAALSLCHLPFVFSSQDSQLYYPCMKLLAEFEKTAENFSLSYFSTKRDEYSTMTRLFLHAVLRLSDT